MRHSWRNPRSLAAAAALLLLVGLTACGEGTGSSPDRPEDFQSRTPASQFQIVDLGTLGGDSSVAFGLSQTNRVVGVSRTATGELHAFFWTPTQGGMQDLGTLGGDFSVAYAINGNDFIVGQSATASGELHAFLTSPGQTMTDLGTLGGDYSIALGLNIRNEVVGLSRTTSGELHGFLWTQANGMRDLGTLGGDYSVGYGIDSYGAIAGYARTSAGQLHAFRIPPGGTNLVDLGTLGGPESWAQDAEQVGNFGSPPGGPPYVVGYSQIRIPDPGGSPARPNPSSRGLQGLRPELSSMWLVYHAFRWTPSEGMVDLGAGGGLHSFAFGVNEFGDVVGQVVNQNGEDRAFFWNESHGFYNLGTLGGPTSFANAVTKCGNAVGGSEDAAGKMHAVIWTQSCPRQP